MMNHHIAIALISVGLSGAAFAASQAQSMVVTPTTGKEPVMLLADGKTAKEMSSGQVKRINKGSKKITIKHGEIKSLEMPPMTMAFKVADEAMLEAVKKGDDVTFHVDGDMVITIIEPAK